MSPGSTSPVAPVLMPAVDPTEMAILPAEGLAGIEILPASTDFPRSVKQLQDPGSQKVQSLVGIAWEHCAGLGDVPELGFLGWELAEAGQPLEVLLSALDFGKRLAAVGINLLFGPSLALAPDPAAAFGDRPDVVGKAASTFVEGLGTAGICACPGQFDPRWAEESGLADEGLPFGAVIGRGVRVLEAGLVSPGQRRTHSGSGAGDVGIQWRDRDTQASSGRDRRRGPGMRCLRPGIRLDPSGRPGNRESPCGDAPEEIQRRGLGDRLEEAAQRISRLRAEA